MTVDRRKAVKMWRLEACLCGQDMSAGVRGWHVRSGVNPRPFATPICTHTGG